MLDALERSQAGDGFDSEFDGFSSDDDRKDDDEKIIGVGLKVPQVMVREISSRGDAIEVNHDNMGGQANEDFPAPRIFLESPGTVARERRRSWTGGVKRHADLLFNT